MSNANGGKDAAAVLHALDPDLPFIASEAAIELDCLLAGKPLDMSAVRTLSERLHNSLTRAHQDGGIHSLMDPATVSVLGEGVNQSGGPQVTTVDELIEKASAIADILAKPDPKTDRERVTWVRAFCVGLSKSAAAYRKSIYDLRPSHPYRK